MAGYTRNDTTDQISNGNTVDADTLDGEFDAIQAGFNAVSGHSHDGSVGEGAPILVVGPTQDVVASANSLTPKTDDAIDLGSASYEWRNLFVDGTANIDSLVADTADINGGTLDNVVIGGAVAGAITGTTITATGFVGPLTGAITGDVTGNLTGNVTGNADTATALATARNINGTAFDGSTNITTTSWGTSRTLTVGATGKAVDGSGAVSWSLSEIGVGSLGEQDSGSVTITGGSISGITDLAIADGGTGASTAAAALVNLGLTATAAELNTLDGITASVAELNILDGVTSTATELNILDGVTATAAEINALDGITATVTELNYTDGVTSNIQTQLDTKAPLDSPALTGTPTAPTASEGTSSTQLATTAFVQTEAGKMIGVGQTWQTPTRTHSTSYQNTSGEPIMVAISVDGSTRNIQVSVDGSSWIGVFQTPSGRAGTSFIVPNNWYYRIDGSTTVVYWAELRA